MEQASDEHPEPNDRAAKRRRFTTECHILSAINTDPAICEIRDTLNHVQADPSPQEISPTPIDLNTNMFLDNLAYCISRGHNDSVAVALTELTLTKIELTIQIGRLSPDKEYDLDPVKVKDHVERIFTAIRGMNQFRPFYKGPGPPRRLPNPSQFSPTDINRLQDLFIDLTIYQLKHSFENIIWRFEQLREFREEARKFLLPFEASVQFSRSKDKFFIPRLPKRGYISRVGKIYKLYEENADIRERPLPLRLRFVVARSTDNFNRWTRAFTWFFDELERQLFVFHRDGSGVDFEKLAHMLGVFAGVVITSNFFRAWVDTITRSSAGGSGDVEKLKEVIPGTKLPGKLATLGKKQLAGLGNLSIRKVTRAILPADTIHKSWTQIKKRVRLPIPQAKGLRKGTPSFIAWKESKTENGILGACESCGVEDDDDELSTPLQEFDEPEDIKNVTFKKLCLILRSFSAVKYTLWDFKLGRHLEGRTLTVKILTPSDDHEETTETECEPLRETAAWVLKYGTGRGQMDRKVDTFISQMEERLTSSPKKERQSRLQLPKEVPKIFVPQHAELLLLSYLKKQLGKTKPFHYVYPYIGLAKAPCFVCELVLRRSGDYKFIPSLENNLHVCVCHLPADLPDSHQEYVFDAVDKLTRGVARTFYNEKSELDSDGDSELETDL
ncbi:hypothetical protein TWF730_007584 [Orbilia blumenaviensis]|uniref:Uncharacterized protein n=1 Tax=Orbilia blumenaviensis TaxID=1796055 RepID=A0AAV9VAL1_9PEZI